MKSFYFLIILSFTLTSCTYQTYHLSNQLNEISGIENLSRGTFLALNDSGDDPVVYMEHKDLWLAEGQVSDNPNDVIDIGKANIMRKGSDLSIVSWSKMALLSLEAADQLKSEGISAEIINLRSLWPWDKDTIYKSVSKTGRLLVAQESVQVAGFGAEISADISENLNHSLKTYVRRIGAPRTPVPYSEPMENEYRVTTTRIIKKAKELFSAP